MARLSSNNNTATKERRSFLSSNPVMHRLDKVDEYSESNAATYGGIAAKTVYFLLFTIVGIAAERILSQMLATKLAGILEARQLFLCLHHYIPIIFQSNNTG